MEEFYIKLLCKTIEERLGYELTTTDDFKMLSERVFEVTGDRLSVSTLKRCFGRFGRNIVQRYSTLSILARYAGFRDWNDFITTLRESLSEESDFKPIDAIAIENIPVGDQLKISWLPNREIIVEYLGDRRFKILDAVNTKLQQNDIIEIAMLASNQPMFISHILRRSNNFTGYLAGQYHGVNVEIRSKKA